MLPNSTNSTSLAFPTNKSVNYTCLAGIKKAVQFRDFSESVEQRNISTVFFATNVDLFDFKRLPKASPSTSLSRLLRVSKRQRFSKAKHLNFKDAALVKPSSG